MLEYSVVVLNLEIGSPDSAELGCLLFTFYLNFSFKITKLQGGEENELHKCTEIEERT